MRKNVVVHKYTLHSKIARLGLVICKEKHVHKIGIVCTV